MPVPCTYHQPIFCGRCRTASFGHRLAASDDPYALLETAPAGWLIILPSGPALCPACNPWNRRADA